MNILIAIIVFGLIIAIHELGHFLAAKKFDVRINEFSIGMGPAIYKKKKGETQYSVRLFPIGGFVSMEGEDEASNDERALSKKPVWQRIIITVAGAVMNLILGLIVVLIMTSIGKDYVSTRIDGFHENSVSSKTGLMKDDKIVKVNGMSILTVEDLSYKLLADEDGYYDMTVVRDGEKIKLNNVQLLKDEGKDGKGTIHVDFYLQRDAKSIGTVLSYTGKSFVSTARLIWVTLIDLISGKYGLNDLSGPVGIVNVIGDVMKPDVSVDISAMMNNLLYLVSFITINVGIFNLLPLPALDGGRIFFLIIEGIRKKPIKPEIEGAIHFVGLALLMVLMVVVTFNDIIKII